MSNPNAHVDLHRHRDRRRRSPVGFVCVHGRLRKHCHNHRSDPAVGQLHRRCLRSQRDDHRHNVFPAAAIVAAPQFGQPGRGSFDSDDTDGRALVAQRVSVGVLVSESPLKAPCSVWGTEGPGFESRQPDQQAQRSPDVPRVRAGPDVGGLSAPQVRGSTRTHVAGPSLAALRASWRHRHPERRRTVRGLCFGAPGSVRRWLGSRRLGGLGRNPYGR